ncbi:MAG: hypothetical protein ACR2O1_13085 [Boseongicola sp.]
MDVSEALDNLRAEVTGCELAAFTDLSSKMVLCVSAGGRRAQEELDALSQIAVTVLEGAVADGALNLLDEEKPDSAMTLTKVDLRVFLRSPSTVNEALICVCSPQTDIAAVMERGRSALDQIVATG